MQKQFVRALVGSYIFERGEEIYKSGHVSPLDISIDRDAMIVEIKAEVRIPRYPFFAHVRLVLDSDSNWLIDAVCDCNYYRMRRTTCEHITAVLIKYAEEYSGKTISRKRKTESVIRDLMSSLADTHTVMAPKAPVIIEPHIAESTDNRHRLSVSFKAGMRGSHMYVIQNLTSFFDSYRKQETVRFGKGLEFTPDKKYIDPHCHELFDFLEEVTSGDDQYSDSGSSYYYSYLSHDTLPKRNLYLQGRYLDRFMKAVRDIPVYFDAYRGQTSLLEYSDELPDIRTELEKEEGGYSFKGSAPSFYTGHEYIYFVDSIRHRIMKTARTDSSFEKVLEYLTEEGMVPHFISEEDLPGFSRYLYPLVSAKTRFKAEEFDPYDYTPLKPAFEIYLDLPQDNMVTCELYAVYGKNKYDLLKGISEDNRRDKEAEQEMDTFVTGWFNSFDNQNHKLALIDDDDKMYALLKEGIPQMQEKASVFISDAMKKLTVRSAPKISVGVSVSHDLLQLDLVSDDIDMKQMAEILNKYDRKKKYYRLKTGEFIDAGDSFDDLYKLTEELSVSPKNISSGSVTVPEYRAYYIDSLADEGFMEIERDMHFRDLIRKAKETEDKEYPLPENLNAQLRPYQVDGFEWLSRLYENHFGALLADEMGLGKTLQVIAFIGSLKKRERTLIVCPASLVYNWSSEIQRFMPSLRSRMILGSQGIRKELIHSSEKQDILITSYDLLKRDIEEYQDMSFTVQIIDEAQYIKNAGTQAARAVKNIKASFKIALTGTPIENRLSELWSIFDYLMPGFLYSYRRFKDMFELPIVRDQDDLAEDDLRKMITPFVLRRLKKDVLKDLPDKLEEVYYAPLEEEQKQLYDARVARLKLMLEKETDEEFRDNKIAMLAELTRLRQLCCNPSLIYDHYHANSAKTDMCIDLIKNGTEAGHKILLFSQFTSMLDILTRKLQEEQIPFHLLTGSTPARERAEMVESFKTDNVPVFCISLKAGGTGLNLTAADIVIHYDPWWNTAVENQASDRAHRIGQENIVTVYRLIMKDTIEERILQLQQEKSGLADKILSSEGISSSSLSREDLLQLL
ncbi:MAG TPA: helicase [Erysipelotrichaceae bacterium]|nr:helicase [Erysipelotrichaceae bacterium]